MRSVSGVDRVLEAMKKKLPTGTYEAIAKTLTPDIILKTGKAEWDADVADFVGREAEVGQAWVSVEEFPWADGSIIKYYAATKVTAQAPLPDGKAGLKVVCSYSTNPDYLKGFLGDAGVAALAGLKPLPGTAKVSGERQRVVDPTTLVWYEGKSRRWIQAPTHLPGAEEFLVTLTEEKTYTVTITPPKKG